MKSSIVELCSQEIEEISGGWIENIPETIKEGAKILLLISGPIIGFAVGITLFISCTKPAKSQHEKV